MRIASLIASLGDDHHQPTPPASFSMQCEVYEGVGDPTIFSPMRTTCTRLPAHRRNTPMGLSPTCSPVLPSQIAIVDTSTCAPPLASQDAQIKLSSSVATDVVVDTQASVGDVSLVNEINSALNPIWVKCGVISAGAISSNVSLGVNDSHPSQDFSQEPDEYNFDPDPGTNSNSFYSKLQGNLPFCFILLWHCGRTVG